MATNNKQIKHFDSFLSAKGSRKGLYRGKIYLRKAFSASFLSVFLFRCFRRADSKKGGEGTKAACEGVFQNVTLTECARKLRMKKKTVSNWKLVNLISVYNF